MLILTGYAKNDFDVYGRDSSIPLSRRGRGRSYLCSLYDFARRRKKEVRVESKSRVRLRRVPHFVRHKSLRNLEDSGISCDSRWSQVSLLGSQAIVRDAIRAARVSDEKRARIRIYGHPGLEFALYNRAPSAQ